MFSFGRISVLRSVVHSAGVRAYCTRKPHCNVGTIGHVDHGKTTLTAAITKVLSKSHGAKFKSYAQIDKSQEERARGITISATHVEYETDARHYSHIDCPGHQNYIKNMIVGAAQMDGAVLVVAASEGAQEQTIEHILLARETGIKQLVVYLNKCDMLEGEEDLIEMAEDEVRGHLEFYGFDPQSPVIRGSARMALEEESDSDMGSGSVRKLMDAVDTFIEQPVRRVDEPFEMCIEDVFSIVGRGTVVTGKIDAGRIKPGDAIETVGIMKPVQTTCIGVEQFNQSRDEASAGENVGILLRKTDREEVTRGQLLAKPGIHKAYKKFVGKAYFMKSDEGGRKHAVQTGFMPQFFVRAANVTGQLSTEGKSVETGEDRPSMIMPGDTAEFEVTLVAPLALAEGLRFTIREGKGTVGAGIVLKCLE